MNYSDMSNGMLYQIQLIDEFIQIVAPDIERQWSDGKSGPGLAEVKCRLRCNECEILIVITEDSDRWNDGSERCNLRRTDMNYEMTPGELKKQDPSLLVKRLCITQENNPGIDQDGKWVGLFRFAFSCECNGAWVEFEFEQADPIAPGQYSWPQAVEKWLIPHLSKLPNAM